MGTVADRGDGEATAMERHRCTHCRNPIRSLAVARPGTGGPGEHAWFHPDCWDVVCHGEQERYELQVQTLGLAALIAPYAASLAARATGSPGVATALEPRPA